MVAKLEVTSLSVRNVPGRTMRHSAIGGPIDHVVKMEEDEIEVTLTCRLVGRAELANMQAVFEAQQKGHRLEAGIVALPKGPNGPLFFHPAAAPISYPPEAPAPITPARNNDTPTTDMKEAW